MFVASRIIFPRSVSDKTLHKELQIGAFQPRSFWAHNLTVPVLPMQQNNLPLTRKSISPTSLSGQRTTLTVN